MAQIVQYAAIPNMKQEQYYHLIGRITGFVKEADTLSYKGLRDWLKQNNLWHKEDTPKYLKVIGVVMERKQPIRVLDRFLDDFSKAEDKMAQKKVMYRHLFRLNPLLIKYVMDALDTDREGRLHSTHELHRMLSSFVYPGVRIDLVPFKAWIEWAAACEMIRLIGIRWGLGEVGKAYIRDIRDFDVEEFLEDEEERVEDPEAGYRVLGGEVEEPEATVDVPVDKAVTSGQDVAASEAQATAEASRDDSPRQASRKRETTVTSRRRSTRQRDPLVQLPAVSAHFTPVEIPQSALSFDGESLLKTKEFIMNWWEQHADKKTLSFSDVGLDYDQFQMNQERFIFIAAFISLLFDQDDLMVTFDEKVSFINYLNEIEFFDIYLEPDLTFEVALQGFDFSFSPASPHLFRMLMAAIPLKHAINEYPTIFVDIESTPEPVELIKHLQSTLYKNTGAFHAPFWLVREFHREGMLTGDVHTVLAAFSLLPGRQAASRLGFTKAGPVRTVEDMVAVCRDVSASFDNDDDYADPLNHFSLAFQCGTPCPKTAICPLTCHEKLPWNRMR